MNSNWNYDWYGRQASERLLLLEGLSDLTQQFDKTNNDARLTNEEKRKRKKEIEQQKEKLLDEVSNDESALFHKILVERGHSSADEYRQRWVKKVSVPEDHKMVLRKLVPTLDAAYIKRLPKYSWGIQFEYMLATPYISRDDRNFYIIDNPVRKEKVFKVPMISSSSWKGNLRWVMRMMCSLGPTADDCPEIIKLFGNERGEEDEFNRGRLQFYPTFFFEIGMEVLNPHNRKTRAGTMPILIESVPVGAAGKFSLLYIPYDLMGKPEGLVRREVAKDLDLTVRSLRGMMLTFGFSAKRTSGFGLAKDDFKGLHFEVSGIRPTSLPANPQTAREKTVKTSGLANWGKAVEKAGGSSSTLPFDETLIPRANSFISYLIPPLEREVGHD